ncbi:MAG: right-handed parallel beta-helix repeat-containing protein, partial [Planctomycetota bacterium]|nr:right-handed parallel beta-helix repeat-containing protein [Planctomycetota bacterium]
MERLADSRFLRQSLALFGCMMISAGSVRAEIILVPDDYRTIQEAIDAAAGGDEIIVAPGTYAERINFLGKAIWLHSAVGADATIIDGSGLYEAVVTCNYGEGPDTVFEGFTITGGDGYWGGGMYIHNSSPTVLDCTFTANYAAYGGGLCNFYETPIIAECTFIDNAAGSGGGLYSRTSDPIIRECVFLENIAGSFGGGVGGLGECEPDVSGCVFIGNMAQSGGAFHTQLTSPQFTDCL